MLWWKFVKRVGRIKPTILHKEVKSRERMELIFLSVSCMAAMELEPPHMSFLLILNNIRKALEESHSRGTYNWCCCGMVPALLDHQAPALHHVAPLPSGPAKDACCYQICLPSSHRHCTFQQEFSVYIVRMSALPSRRSIVPGKTPKQLASP